MVQKLEEESLIEFVEDLVINDITDQIRLKVVPAFWKPFYEADGDLNNDFIRFRDSVANLNSHYLSYLHTMQRLEEMRKLGGRNEPIFGETNLLVVLKLIFRTVLQSQLPIPRHQRIIEEFYKLSFKVFYNADKSNRSKPFTIYYMWLCFIVESY